MATSLFFKNLKYLRKKHHITQEEMGKKFGVKRTTYAHMENYCNKIELKPEVRMMLLKEFGYTVDDLLTIDLQRNDEIVPTQNLALRDYKFTTNTDPESTVVKLTLISEKLKAALYNAGQPTVLLYQIYYLQSTVFAVLGHSSAFSIIRNR